MFLQPTSRYRCNRARVFVFGCGGISRIVVFCSFCSLRVHCVHLLHGLNPSCGMRDGAGKRCLSSSPPPPLCKDTQRAPRFVLSRAVSARLCSLIPTPCCAPAALPLSFSLFPSLSIYIYIYIYIYIHIYILYSLSLYPPAEVREGRAERPEARQLPRPKDQSGGGGDRPERQPGQGPRGDEAPAEDRPHRGRCVLSDGQRHQQRGMTARLALRFWFCRSCRPPLASGAGCCVSGGPGAVVAKAGCPGCQGKGVRPVPCGVDWGTESGEIAPPGGGKRLRFSPGRPCPLSET